MTRIFVNGYERVVDTPSGPTLLDLLRDDLKLTGTKYACGEGQCGACTVQLNGSPVRACTVDLAAADGATVTTVEGLAADGRLHPVQQAFVDARALQCGYCTPGMVMATVALLAKDPDPEEATVRRALAGNVCRCGGYPRILRAVRAAAGTESVQTAGSIGGTEPIETAVQATWTVVLPPLAKDGRSGWGWSTPGGARLTLDSNGLVRAYTGKVDGGQGNRVSLTRMVAAELSVSTSMIRLEMGDTEVAPFDLGTFGSRSTPDVGHALRLLAVETRRALLMEAARRWDVSPDGLVAAGGSVRDPVTGREIAFGALVADGPRTIEVDPDEALDTALAGLAGVDPTQLRQGLVRAVTGMKQFPSDIRLPGLLHGAVLRPPAYGARLRHVDTAAARQLPGVTVVEADGFVGVVAASQSAARAALRSVASEWEPVDGPGDVGLASYLRDHPVDSPDWGGSVRREAGDVDAARVGSAVRLEATYTTPYIAHVPMEPRVALAQVGADRVTVWVGSQRPFGVRSEVAAALGLPEERVRVVVPDFGGGFGGKHSGDVAVEAARLSQAAGAPVRVAWTREEEFRWAYLRPAAVIDVRSAATADGFLTGWSFININSGAAGLFSPYVVANRREQFQPADSPLRQGSYRALAATANNFARESHIDEMSAALRLDPLELRLRHLDDPRLVDVLTAVTERIGWSERPTEPGRGAGLACGLEKDSRVATAVEVTVDPDGRLRLVRVVTAFDCGAVVDPEGLTSQVTGATIMGLGGALFEGIRFNSGVIHNAALSGYRVPRFPDIPPIDVIVLDRPDIESAGAGETPIIAIAPAIANAVYAATGRRLRSLPLTPDGTLPPPPPAP